MTTTTLDPITLRRIGIRIAVLDVDHTPDNVEQYLRAARTAGADPVMLDDDLDLALEQLSTCRGLMVTGTARDGRDLAPVVYHRSEGPLLGPVDAERDLRQLDVISAALRWHMPVMGTCLGMQLVVALMGGSLIQHVERHSPGADQDSVPTALWVEPGSVLHGIVGSTTTGQCLHHQVVTHDLPPSLEATAWCVDGYVHAAEGRRVWLFQHHPERDLTGDGLRVYQAWMDLVLTGHG